jgi:hypothetical protein
MVWAIKRLLTQRMVSFSATAEAFQWRTVSIGSGSASHEKLFRGVLLLTLLNIAAISSSVVILHFLQRRDNSGEIPTLSTLLMSPHVQTPKNVSALHKELGNLWKTAFVFLVALCTRLFRLQRHGVPADFISRLLFGILFSLVGAWIYHRVQLFNAMEEPLVSNESN